MPLSSQFAIWAATLLDLDKSILLVNEPGKDDEVITRLSRTGLHNIDGVLDGGIESWI